MFLEHVFQDHNLGAKFHRSTRESYENLPQGMQGILTETTNGQVTELVAIPFVIFFPDLNEAQSLNSKILSPCKTQVYLKLRPYHMQAKYTDPIQNHSTKCRWLCHF